MKLALPLLYFHNGPQLTDSTHDERAHDKHSTEYVFQFPALQATLALKKSTREGRIWKSIPLEVWIYLMLAQDGREKFGSATDVALFPKTETVSG